MRGVFIGLLAGMVFFTGMAQAGPIEEAIKTLQKEFPNDPRVIEDFLQELGERKKAEQAQALLDWKQEREEERHEELMEILKRIQEDLEE